MAPVTVSVAGADTAPKGKNDSGQKIEIAGFPEDVQGAMRAFDTDGDGTVDPVELQRAAVLLVESRQQVSKLKKYLSIAAVVAFLFLCIFFGLVYAVVELSKESKLSGDVMVSTTTGDVVQTANSDMSTDASGRLTTRSATADADAAAEGGAPPPGRRRLSAFDEHPLITVAAEVVKHDRAMSSCMPNSYFSELTHFKVKAGLVEMQLNVLGFVRMPRVTSLYGTVVMLVTHVGRVVVDGETLSYIDDIGDVFAEAGFNIDHGNRRLLDLLDITGFFNSIPADAWACYEESTDGPTPAFPGEYTAFMTSYSPCMLESTEMYGSGDQCDPMSMEAWQLDHQHELENWPGKFSKAYGRQAVSLDRGIAIEEWNLPARSSDYKRMYVSDNTGTYKWMAPNAEGSDLVALGGRFTEHVKTWQEGRGLIESGDAVDASDASLDSVGFYCKADVKEQDSKPMEEIHKVPENAAYRGVVTLPEIGEARHWVVRMDDPKNDLLLELYDQETSSEDYEFLPVRIDMISISTNKIVKRIEISDWRFGSDMELDFAGRDALSFTPDLCFYYGRTEGLDLESGGVVFDDPAGGIVEHKDILLSAAPHPASDRSAIDMLKYTSETIVTTNDRNTTDIVSYTAGDRKLLAQPGRQLLGYSNCKDSSGYAVSRDYDPIAEFNVAVPPITVGIEVSATVAQAAGLGLCFVSGSVSGFVGIGTPSLPVLGSVQFGVYIGGEIYADWDPNNFANAYELGGCIFFKLGAEIGPVDITIFQITGCLLGGVGGDPNNNVRGYIAFQIAASAGVDFFIASGEITASLFLKFFLHNNSIKQVDFHPYFQVDGRACVWWWCTEFPSMAFNILGDSNPMMKAW